MCCQFYQRQGYLSYSVCGLVNPNPIFVISSIKHVQLLLVSSSWMSWTVLQSLVVAVSAMLAVQVIES